MSSRWEVVCFMASFLLLPPRTFLRSNCPPGLLNYWYVFCLTPGGQFTYSGPCYISEGSSSGDVTLIFKRNGVSKKADFIGNHIIFIAKEK